MKLRRTYPLLAAVAVLGAAAYIAIAHTTAPPDRPVNSATAPPSDRAVNSGEAAPLRTAARSPDAAVERPPSAGNPLWALPLKQLSITRERPIFSLSRRPPPPATPTYVAPVAVRTPSKPAEPERPSITLLGTILGSTESIGIFFNPTTRDIVRLRVGEDHEGWALRSVKTREATLVKDRERVVLELPPPGESAMSMTDFTPPDVRAPPSPARRQQRH
jgi:general secretion pathway protein N